MRHARRLRIDCDSPLVSCVTGPLSRCATRGMSERPRRALTAQRVNQSAQEPRGVVESPKPVADHCSGPGSTGSTAAYDGVRTAQDSKPNGEGHTDSAEGDPREPRVRASRTVDAVKAAVPAHERSWPAPGAGCPVGKGEGHLGHGPGHRPDGRPASEGVAVIGGQEEGHRS